MVVSQTDIAIIGGGAQGLMLAYYAKKGYPQKSVVLLESGLIGQGITAFSAIFILLMEKATKIC